MNIFRSLIGKVWQDPNAAEVVKISTGQLYLVRPGNIRSERECIYNEAMATIRRVPSMEHNFQLVITRVYEDGDQELLEDEDETDAERVFLISKELEFRTSEMDGEPTFVWRDLEGDVDELYEYLAHGTNEPTRAFFETCMYRAMWERQHRQTVNANTDPIFDEFIYRPPQKKGKSSKATSPKGEPTPPPSEPPAVAHPADEEPFTIPESLEQEDWPLETLVEFQAELYFWDLNEGEFKRGADVRASVAYKTDAAFEYYLLGINSSGSRILAHRISSAMNQRWVPNLFSLTWNNISEDGTPSSWLLQFEDAEEYQGMVGALTQAVWETLHQQPWSKLKAEERNYVQSSTLEDVEMRDVEDEVDEQDIEAELDPENESEDEGEGQGEVDDDEERPPKSNDLNSQLIVGYKGDRTYVVRGDNIGMFNTTPENGVKFASNIGKIATTKGKSFKPKHVMLHDRDTKMILMNDNEPNSLFNMDIERAKVVEEWKVHDDITVDHIAPDKKFAQMTPEQTLVGASHNALFRIDPRVSGTKMVESQYKQYVSKNKFSGVTTTATGQLAVASEKGDIRLFDSIGKNAKTALPPLGDPILGIDVTADGRWIVATTKTYLLLIDTLIGEGKYAGSLGFDRSFPATAKPVPKRLQLRSEHVAYMGHAISFTPARFNQGEGKTENTIVTSTGQFVVAWDFAKIKKGIEKYDIKKYEDKVVQDNFKFGDDKEIIVALQNNVLAVNKKNLKKPSRTSFGVVGRNMRSSSGIVNSPF